MKLLYSLLLMQRGPSSLRGGGGIGTLKVLRQYGVDSLLREVVLTPQQLSENLQDADYPPHQVSCLQSS